MESNIHHIVASSIGGSNKPCNKIALDKRVHTALHTLFQNQSPVEQMRSLLMINISALKDEFVEDLLEVLECEKPYKCNAVRDKSKLDTGSAGVARYPRIYTPEQ